MEIEVQPKDTSKGHFYVSMVKSALRIIAGGNLVIGNLFWAGTFLILAEILGIIEELV
jgi:predicted ATP-dependent Lon-type protease